MYAYASAEQIITPRGWNIDSKAKRKRLFCVHQQTEIFSLEVYLPEG